MACIKYTQISCHLWAMVGMTSHLLVMIFCHLWTMVVMTSHLLVMIFYHSWTMVMMTSGFLVMVDMDRSAGLLPLFQKTLSLGKA